MSILLDKTSIPARMPLWIKLWLCAGLLCIGQFFIFALLGVIRGYSVQSWTPCWIMLWGVSLLIPFSSRSKEKTQFSWISSLISFCIILFSIVGMLQGRYRIQGDKFYEQKNYAAAITMYQKEINTWYLRLKYNHNEDISLFGIAQSYCQLENFEQAGKTYQRLLEMARGYYQERAQNELTELDRTLVKIAAFVRLLVSATDDNQKAEILFDLALSYRDIECAKKAREQYELIQTLNIRESTKELARTFAADEQW